MADNSSTCLKVDIQLQKELETFFLSEKKFMKLQFLVFCFISDDWILCFILSMQNFKKYFPRLNLPGFGKSGQKEKRTKRVLFLALQKDFSTL